MRKSNGYNAGSRTRPMPPRERSFTADRSPRQTISRDNRRSTQLDHCRASPSDQLKPAMRSSVNYPGKQFIIYLARLKEITTRWNEQCLICKCIPIFFNGRSFTSVFIFVPSRYALNRTVLCIIMLHRATETRQTLNTKAIIKALANYPATNANKSTYTVISCRHISTRQNVNKTSWATTTYLQSQ